MQISYRILDHRPDQQSRTVDVQATAAELAQLRDEGYIVRPRLITGDLLHRLRAAADELERIHLPLAKNINGAGFGGLFVRNLIDLHPAFHELLKFAPMLSVARAMLGPQVQLHGSVLRVSYPNEKQQAVEWHFHQRVVPDPRPAFFHRPVVIDNLLYLDDLTPQAGPLVVLPRTHHDDVALPAGDFSDKPGQVVVTCPAGSVVTSHASLWHRALPPGPNAPKRRLIIWGHSPTWMKQVDKPSAGGGKGLSDGLLAGADEGMKELLGLSGWY